MNTMEPLDTVLEALKKMPQEEKVKSLPALEELTKMFRLNNEAYNAKMHLPPNLQLL